MSLLFIFIFMEASQCQDSTWYLSTKHQQMESHHVSLFNHQMKSCWRILFRRSTVKPLKIEPKFNG
ncbi:hypothetical protein H5410_004652 [Solanum commersonii]|uniref:Secreted protein n=1 Tax=Solanum commersonii TaxID=4109 RepID=A0A9J6B911_SOLCO|nr:hypothetical protein H5410_004652 [Solanum commersonii]